MITSLISRNVAAGMEIDANFALQSLHSYVEDMEALERGVPYASLGISSRREATKPILLVSSEEGVMEEVAFSRMSTTNGAVAVLRISGVMRSEDGLSSYGMSTFAENLRAADESPNVKAIVVEINSGGGESTAGQIAELAIKDTTKPVIAVAQFMGSAAYRAALQADKIYAAGSGSMIGSIGSFITLDRNFPELYDKFFQDIYSDYSPNKNREFREWMKGNTDPFKELVNSVAKEFRQDVKKHRNLKGNIEETLSGGMFFAKDALSRGLIDGVKSIREAALEALKMADKPAFRNPDSQNLSDTDMSNLASRIAAMIMGKPNTETEEPEVETPEIETEEPETDTEETQEQEPESSELAETVQEHGQNLEAIVGTLEKMNGTLSSLSARLAKIESKQTEIAKVVAKEKGKPVVDNQQDGGPDYTSTEKAFKAGAAKVKVNAQKK